VCVVSECDLEISTMRSCRPIKKKKGIFLCSMKRVAFATLTGCALCKVETEFSMYVIGLSSKVYNEMGSILAQH
jgi:hypothetical protein